jgi:tetratricopeptide (TPR) repeat protein
MDQNRTLLFACIAVIIIVSFSLIPTPVPTDIINDAHLAAISVQNNQPYRAISFYEKILEYQPYRLDLIEKMGIEAQKAGENDLAINRLLEVSAKKKLTDPGWLALGKVYDQQGQTDAAENAWLMVTVGSESGKEALDLLLDACIKTDQWQKAVDLLGKWKQSSTSKEYKLRIAEYQFFLDPATFIALYKNYQDNPPFELISAATVISNSTRTIQDQASAWLNAGGYFEDQKEFALAEKAYHQATLKMPSSGLPWAYLALLKQNQDHTGQMEIKQAVSLEPENSHLAILAGRYWQNDNKPDIALLYFQKANQLTPDNAQILRLVGSAELDLNNIQTGLDYLTQAAQLTLDDPAGWNLITSYCLDHNAFIREVALDAVRKSILADDRNPTSLDLAGQVYWQLGDHLTGKKYLEKALEVNPQYYPSHVHLGVWLIQNGDYADGMSHLQLAANQNMDLATKEQATKILNSPTQ